MSVYLEEPTCIIVKKAGNASEQGSRGMLEEGFDMTDPSFSRHHLASLGPSLSLGGGEDRKRFLTGFDEVETVGDEEEEGGR